MMEEDLLDRYRQEGTLVRIVRDADPANDVLGTVVAWDDQTVLVRKRNRRVVKLDRSYTYIPADQDRGE